MVAPALTCHLIMALGLYGSLGLLLKYPWLWCWPGLLLQAVLQSQKLSYSPGWALQAPHSSTQYPPISGDTCLSLGHAGWLNRPSTYISFCPNCHRLAVVAFLWASNLSQLVSLLVRGLFQWQLPLSFSSLFFFFLLSYLVAWSDLLSFQLFEFFRECLADILLGLFHLYP